MSKNHDDIDQDTTAAEAADSLKAWLASPAQGDTHAEDSEAASEPENTPNEDAPGDDAEEDAQEGTQEPQEEPGDHQREDDTPAAPEAASGPERRPQCRCVPCVRRTSRARARSGHGARASTDPPPPRSVLASQGNDTRTRDARTAAQQPRARSDEDSNEEDHAPAHAPPRARPYATTVSPGGGITRPALLSVRQAC